MKRLVRWAQNAFMFAIGFWAAYNLVTAVDCQIKGKGASWTPVTYCVERAK